MEVWEFRLEMLVIQLPFAVFQMKMQGGMVASDGHSLSPDLLVKIYSHKFTFNNFLERLHKCDKNEVEWMMWVFLFQIMCKIVFQSRGLFTWAWHARSQTSTSLRLQVNSLALLLYVSHVVRPIRDAYFGPHMEPYIHIPPLLSVKYARIKRRLGVVSQSCSPLLQSDRSPWWSTRHIPAL